MALVSSFAVLRRRLRVYGTPRLRLVVLLAVVGVGVVPRSASAITRRDFPEGFVFGAGSSAFQVEGAAAEDGRTPSIWDTFAHEGYSYDGSTADVSADQYHHYKEDVKLMHAMGLDAYRFSIGWPRLIPDGRGEINPKGLEYYNNLIDELILHGIQPHATIYHFDLPQVLQDEYGGLLSPKFIEDYIAFAEVCFKNFGDRVKHWVTVNEPNIETIGGYDIGSQPPRRCSSPFGENCTGGNSSTEPYVAAHHLLLAHASAVSLYRNKYKPIQGGQIGITLLGWWHEPATSTSQDAAAASRMNDFHIGWFMHPLVYGDYPPLMRSRVGDRLPRLSAEESARVRGSLDFVGFNHYLILRVRSSREEEEEDSGQTLRDYYVDASVQNPLEDIAEGRIESPPWALAKLLEHLKVNYGNPPVVIHENGLGESPDTPGAIEHDDDSRSEFLQSYLEVLYHSIRLISRPTRPKGRGPDPVRALIGGAQSYMVGGPLSPRAIKKGGGRRLKIRGSPEPPRPTDTPIRSRVSAGSDGKTRHRRHDVIAVLRRRPGPVPVATRGPARSATSTYSYDYTARRCLEQILTNRTGHGDWSRRDRRGWNGSDARGYFVWSFLDVFEFLFGYRLSFGLCGVDMAAAARARYPRSSARWYAGFLRGGELRPPPPPPAAALSDRPYAA